METAVTTVAGETYMSSPYFRFRKNTFNHSK